MSIALLHAIITSHAFVDGNKRTGVVAAVLYLGSKGELTGAPSGLQIALLGEVALATARSELDAEAVAHWLERILG